MATVYLARDLKHDREVAIKVLKPELAAVLGAERFVQEIKTTAALSHPHILPLFDSGTADGFLFYVMPYIQGETIRERLNREHQLGVEEAVRIATEVADALDYAHRHGVIHRDIKPENILLHDGRPMVMDFGIALAVSAAAGGRMTETGLSLGTPHYMSPEQATADRDITGRSDVYSLASVLYEMLTGEPPHMGTSAQQIIMKIITERVKPVTELRKSVPEPVATAVQQALEKLPADRFATAKEFADALNGRGSATVLRSAASAAAAPRAIWRQPVVIALAAALAAALVAAVLEWRAAHGIAPPAIVRFQVEKRPAMLIANVATAGNVAVTPDGLALVYTSSPTGERALLYYRRLSEAVGRPLAGAERAQSPTFSPDGRWIAYFVGNEIWKTPVEGGEPVRVGEVTGLATGLAWTPSGLIISGTQDGLLAIPAGGGSGTVISHSDTTKGELFFNQPHVLPDGDHIVFSIQSVGGLTSAHLGIYSLARKTTVRLAVSSLDPLMVIDGVLVYVTPAGVLTAIGVDVDGGRVTGSPVSLGPVIATTIGGASQAALSPSGTLVYQPVSVQATLGWSDASGRYVPLLSAPQAYAYPRLSPDGRRIAVAITAPGRTDVWTYDIASATPVRLTNEGTQNDRPEWSPDGRSVLYRTDRGKRIAIWSQPADLSAAAEPLVASSHDDFFEGVITPDGRWVVYQVDDGAPTFADVMYRALRGDSTVHAITATPATEAQARISPDGKWVTFVTDAGGTSQVVVQPFPGPGGRVQISANGGSEPVWSHDGRRIFYRDGRAMMAATIATSPSFAVTGRTALFSDDYIFAAAPHANFDVSLDGTRFLMVKSAEEPKVQVVYGFQRELRERMRTAGPR